VEIPYDFAPRRPGDPATLIGSAKKAGRELGWRPRFATLEPIVETAWNWHRRGEGPGKESHDRASR
jgi:UDP-glucose 4-epimerase